MGLRHGCSCLRALRRLRARLRRLETADGAGSGVRRAPCSVTTSVARDGVRDRCRDRTAPARAAPTVRGASRTRRGPRPGRGFAPPRPPIRLRRRRPKASCAASAHAGPFKPRRYRPRRANDAVPSRRRRAAPRVLEIATRAPPDPFLALVGASSRTESDPRSTPTLTSCQRAGRRPNLRVVPPPSSLVQFLPREPRREKTRPRSAANICVGVR